MFQCTVAFHEQFQDPCPGFCYTQLAFAQYTANSFCYLLFGAHDEKKLYSSIKRSMSSINLSTSCFLVPSYKPRICPALSTNANHWVCTKSSSPVYTPSSTR